MRRIVLNVFLSFILILLYFPTSFISAVEVQDKTNALVIGKAITIHSKVLNEERPVWIYLPEDYDVFSDKRYPVLYMLDGAFHFHHITGAVQILAKRDRIPQMIVIAIPYIDDERRARDLTPTSVDGYPPVAAPDNFLLFLKDEIIPFTEKNYRTVPYRILFAHSRAGLFSIYLLIKNPEIFNTIICISPSIGWDDRLMFKRMEDFSLEDSNLKRNLFLSVADGDPDRIRIPVIDFAELLKKKKIKGLEFHYNYMKNHDHGTIVHPVFYENLENLYSEWKLTPEQIEGLTFDQIIDHFGKLSEKYGYEITAPAVEVFILKAQQLARAKKTKDAADLLELILKRYPNSYEAHFTRGYVYALDGNLEEARNKMETALKMTDPKSRIYNIYKSNLDWVNKRINETAEDMTE